ncbi:uncharacterized protein H6S33_004991 [Morchella sextelata]|uniref:uncharacterized protein n=1 Tax=Morchella sextelata TaxID=1174677 RepID=UPI001D053D37|nr:uncharacterized protein H6S33_004991 [Morchella sextelata]KAH0605009.1 hypothetical protein H6S33_004991 [Morchella sextelata]
MLSSLLLLPLLLLTSASAQSAFPALSGSYKVGTTSIKVTDTNRTDPLAPTPNTPRSFVLQLFYPTDNSTTAPLAPYMPPATATFYETAYGLPSGGLNTLQPNSHTNASYSGPCKPGIVLFSPGHQTSRYLHTALAEDLASTGHVVLVTDYIYEADIVEFPDGSYILSNFPSNYTDADILAVQATRVADTLYTLNHLRAILRAIPGTDDTTTPGKIAMVGHSLGGSTAAAVMGVDSRVRGGIAMDGKIWGDVVHTGFSGSFMFLGAAANYVSTYESWGLLWAKLRGWRRELHLADARHLTFTDAAVIVELLGLRGVEPDVAEGLVGSIDGLRALKVQKVYVRAFVDMMVGGRRQAAEGRRVLRAADERYGEMEFVQ